MKTSEFMKFFINNSNLSVAICGKASFIHVITLVYCTNMKVIYWHIKICEMKIVQTNERSFTEVVYVSKKKKPAVPMTKSARKTKYICKKGRFIEI